MIQGGLFCLCYFLSKYLFVLVLFFPVLDLQRSSFRIFLLRTMWTFTGTECIPLDVKSNQIHIIPEAICSILNIARVLPFAKSFLSWTRFSVFVSQWVYLSWKLQPELSHSSALFSISYKIQYDNQFNLQSLYFSSHTYWRQHKIKINDLMLIFLHNLSERVKMLFWSSIRETLVLNRLSRFPLDAWGRQLAPSWQQI